MWSLDLWVWMHCSGGEGRGGGNGDGGGFDMLWWDRGLVIV